MQQNNIFRMLFVDSIKSDNKEITCEIRREV